MATTTVGTPPQIPADSSGHTARTEVNTGTGGSGNSGSTGGAQTVTHTYVVRKLTPTGSNGSATIVNGVITAFTAPT
jgi:hypothetical protein